VRERDGAGNSDKFSAEISSVASACRQDFITIYEIIPKSFLFGPTRGCPITLGKLKVGAKETRRNFGPL
jgi:hypothetical protein